jgi:diguanylate cyclase (GGDEF)-like protein
MVVLYGPNVGQVYKLEKNRILIGRDRSAEIRISEVGISRRHAMLNKDASNNYTLEDLGSRNGTYLGDKRLEGPHKLENNDRVRFGASSVLKYVFGSDPEASYALTMYEAAMNDGLTGVFNRRYMEVRLVSELAFARRHMAPVALLLIDLDHFKRVNDTYGHPAGDQVLKEFARLVKKSIRAEDTLGRYGGEEFAILARLTDKTKGKIIAERIRSKIAEHVFLSDSHKLQITVSVGVAAGGSRLPTPEELLQAADRALYQAKKAGRNQVMVYGVDVKE